MAIGPSLIQLLGLDFVPYFRSEAASGAYLTRTSALVDNPRVPAQYSFWSSVLDLGDRLGLDAWSVVLVAALVALISAVYTMNLRRRFRDVIARLANLETLVEKCTLDQSAPSLGNFCKQLMDALGMELPSAVSARMSPDDPARFIRALTIYTRAQRRRLVALYRQAEGLREALHPEGTVPNDHCCDDDCGLKYLAHTGNDTADPRPPQRKRDKTAEMHLVQ